jgi:hypothetical protein
LNQLNEVTAGIVKDCHAIRTGILRLGSRADAESGDLYPTMGGVQYELTPTGP